MSKTTLKQFFVTLLLLLSFIPWISAQTGWKSFSHINGFTIQLPTSFKEGLLVASGTLQYYDNETDKELSISVETFGKGTLSELQESYSDDLETYKGVSYKLIKANWYVLSGEDEEGIFYHKTIIRNGLLHHLRISYPKQQKALIDIILPKIAISFK